MMDSAMVKQEQREPRLVVKVCGMREPDNIRAVEQLGADWLGFIFWPRSSRYVGAPPAYLPQHAKRVGVFVDADIDEVLQHVTDYGLNLIQLHGHESPDYIQALRSALQLPPCRSICNDSIAAHDGLRIIKALNVATRADLDVTRPYDGLVDYLLFDTKGPSVGGNGTQYDWSILDAYQGTTPFLLSGGIGPDDAERVCAFHHPLLAGIDLNSRFEQSPALKDVSLLRRFLFQL